MPADRRLPMRCLQLQAVGSLDFCSGGGFSITEGITAWHSVLPVFLPTALTLAAVGRRISQLAYGIEQIKVFLREPEVAPLPFGEFVARFHDRGLLPVSESAAKLKTDEAK